METENSGRPIHGRYLGVDYGDARTGLAVSDVGGMLAGARTVIRAGGMRGMAVEVAAAAEREGAVRIVIGLPKNMDGSEGFRAQAVRSFAAILSGLTEIPIDFSDERLTTCEANRYLQDGGAGGRRRKEVVDALSAQIILQDYLDREKRFSASSAKNSAKE